MSVVTDRDQAAGTCRDWQEAGEAVVFTNGVFDILHRGHVEYLAEAAALGDRLVVGVNTDASARRLKKGPGRPLNGEADRMAVLAALQVVDMVVPFAEDTPRELIQRLRPDVVAKGGDYTRDGIVGADEVEGWGGKAVVIPLRPGFSTTALVERIRTAPRGGND
jgi:D-beta-D-heptose 7-phosphate kinase/D-beta-D-heptose 1-phosphate adenosyltransferase